MVLRKQNLSIVLMCTKSQKTTIKKNQREWEQLKNNCMSEKEKMRMNLWEI